MRPVFVRAAAAVSALGFDWRGLGSALRDGELPFAPSVQLAPSHGTVMASEVPPVPLAIDVDPRARKLMAHPARLAAVALRLALDDAGWPAGEREAVALFQGVGASACSMEELTRMLGASIEGREFLLERFGKEGLAACNPLFAFQLMNNFSMCHGAILNGTGGPNGAFYSRGTGTVAALAEAHWAIAGGESSCALAGGADSALHPVTWSQLCAQGLPEQGLMPAEGAALLALSASPEGALARLDSVQFESARAAAGKLPAMRNQIRPGDLVVMAPWGEPARAMLGDIGLDASRCFGDALAAAPALAWCAALDLLQDRQHGRALIFSAGIDGGVGLVIFGRPA